MKMKLVSYTCAVSIAALLTVLQLPAQDSSKARGAQKDMPMMKEMQDPAMMREMCREMAKDPEMARTMCQEMMKDEKAMRIMCEEMMKDDKARTMCKEMIEKQEKSPKKKR